VLGAITIVTTYEQAAAAPKEENSAIDRGESFVVGETEKCYAICLSEYAGGDEPVRALLGPRNGAWLPDVTALPGQAAPSPSQATVDVASMSPFNPHHTYGYSDRGCTFVCFVLLVSIQSGNEMINQQQKICREYVTDEIISG
jgi:hypothetical protein